MRDWQLSQSDPLSLRLAADARFVRTDYANDHIWELQWTGGDPPALALRTSYGLRALNMRLFPSFREGETVVTDPADFVSPPAVCRFFVNYLQVAFVPLSDIHVTGEFWAPDSHSLAGRFVLRNTGATPRSVRVRVSAILTPGDNPRVMGPEKVNEVTVLSGQTGDLTPLLFMEGGALTDAGPHPTLYRQIDLAPADAKSARWAQAALSGPAESLDLARQALARDMDGEFARIELINAGLIDIHTGDPDWDAALALAQKVGLQSYVGPSDHLPFSSFIFTRLPERGYSRKGDGSDHSWQWDGQVATEAYVNCPQIVSAAPELAKGIIRNYLSVQAPDGFIDWKPGLAGQRNRALCIPLLASLSWIIYEYTEDRDFLAEVFPGLSAFLDVWFTPRHDRDQDGVPEWTHTIQSAFDDWPSFARLRGWQQGADVTKAEVPDLTAYLYRECVSLMRMAAVIGREDGIARLQDRATRLRDACEGMWRDDTASYHFVDRDHHETAVGEALGQGRGEFVLDVHRTFEPSGRVLVRSFGPRDARPAMSVVLHGRGRRGRHRVETLSSRHFSWYWGSGTASSDKLYRELEKIEVRGLTEEFTTELRLVDYTRQDQTLLLPLWAGIPSPERAEALVRRTVTDPERYWRPYGIPNCSAQDPAYKPDNRDGSGGVWMMWNTMIGEGLVEYGYRAEAAELIRRILLGMVHALKTEQAFREAYNPDKLEGIGERDYLWGVAPVHLFLKTIGVRIISPRKAFVEGRNPFPWPVTVKHRGVSVTKDEHGTRVAFPNGAEFQFDDEAPHFVELPAG